MRFAHLHTHSHYSLLEGLPSTKKLIARAKDQGCEALALTDNGSMYGIIELLKNCKDTGVKPIIGLDAYIAPNKMTDKRARIDDRPNRLVLLVKDAEGYHNLIRLSTIGFTEGFYYKPRIDLDVLEKYSKGLIALTGSTRGLIPSLLKDENEEKALETAQRLQAMFGPDNFYLELIHHPDYPEQQEVNAKLIAFGRKNNIPLVATKNVFYIKPEDDEAYQTLICIQKGKTLEEHKLSSQLEVDLSMSKPEEIAEAFKDVPDAIENIGKIIDNCNAVVELGKNYLPVFHVPGGKSDNDYLRELCEAGLKVRYPDGLTPELIERFEFEFGVIKKMGYASYFLIVHDFVNWAKTNGVLVGPGRGSAAGSLVSYALRITDLDPLKYGLLFERFLNPDRISMPDIDMDFSDFRRGDVMQYVKQKYGTDHVAGIITFGTMAPKAAVRDAARVLGLSFGETNKIAKLIPNPVQGKHVKLEEAIKPGIVAPELAALYAADPTAKRVLDLAIKIVGTPRHASQHACGIVIGDVPLVERVPLQQSQHEDVDFVTQYSLATVEYAGMVKMDFLGLSNLTIIQDCLDIIEAVYKVKIDIEHVPLDDKKTFELLGRAETTGVFQLESDGMKRYIKELQPTVFEDIIAMVALYRPGPMQFIESFINRKHGEEKIEYEHELMKNSLANTYGIPVYQEQVMQLSKDMAGFTAGEADTLRKAMGKKIVELMAKMKVQFIEGAVKKGVAQKTATVVFEKLEAFAAYGFNKSHAACYALIAYRTAFLKAHYPSCFMAALMNSDAGVIERITIEVEECKLLGLEVMPPDVNESFAGFAVVPNTNKIRFGLGAIKNIGDEVAKAIVSTRKTGGPYLSLEDFATRLPTKFFNKKTLESLAQCGALDRYGERGQILENQETILKFHRGVQEVNNNQVSLFGATSFAKPKLNLKPCAPASKNEMLGWEKELLGLYLSSHPFAESEKYFTGFTSPCAKISEFTGKFLYVAGLVRDFKQITTKKGDPMAFATIEDSSGSCEAVIFPKTFKEFRAVFEPGVLAVVSGKLDAQQDGEPKILVSTAYRINDENARDVADTLKRGAPMIQDMKAFETSAVTITVPEYTPKEALGSLKEILQKHPGSSRVYLLMKREGKEQKIETSFMIDFKNEVEKEILKVFGGTGKVTKK
ncbi:MAG: DNA polymerase III subunit alpha [bacterium]